MCWQRKMQFVFYLYCNTNTKPTAPVLVGSEDWRVVVDVADDDVDGGRGWARAVLRADQQLVRAGRLPVQPVGEDQTTSGRREVEEWRGARDDAVRHLAVGGVRRVGVVGDDSGERGAGHDVFRKRHAVDACKHSMSPM